jgi:hypothetical protein
LTLRHPERSRFSGEARDLAWSFVTLRARSLGPLVKTGLRDDAMQEKFKLTHYLSLDPLPHFSRVLREKWGISPRFVARIDFARGGQPRA